MDDLKSIIRIWHPRYRSQLAQLLVIGTIAGGVVYLENTLLQGFVEELSGKGHGSDAVSGLIAGLAGKGAAPVLFLAVISAVGLARVVLSTFRDVVGSRIFIRSRGDVEQSILNHLLHKGDDFYATHATSEIVNRLEVDLFRVLDRRQNLGDVWWSILMILSNLVFFGTADVRLAVVVVIICVLGTLLTDRMSRPVKEADGAYFYSNDHVKMDFEDYLRAVPEIQVGGLFGPVLGRFGRPQGRRQTAFLDWVLADARMAFSRGVWPVLAFLVTVLITLYFVGGPPGEPAGSLTLIPVLIFALPGVFGNVSTLVQLRVQYQLADNSVARLLEYGDEGEKGAGARPQGSEEPPAIPATEPSIALVQSSFQYRGEDGSAQGGVSEVSASFDAGRWYAIVGGAGSGKSTLVNMILGRLRPQQGKVEIGGRSILEVDAGRIAAISSLMPQRVVVFDTTIRENLFIGQADRGADGALDAEDLAVIEDVGFGAVCRLKALEMRPAAAGPSIREAELSGLRREARQLATEAGLAVAGFEEGHVDPSRPCLDALVGGRTSEGAAFGHGAAKWAKRIGESALARELAARARTVIAESSQLLELPDHQAFLEISPEKLPYDAWNLRRSCRDRIDGRELSDEARPMLVRVGLTSSPREWGLAQGEADELFAKWRESFSSEIEALRAAVSGSFEAFDIGRIHPHMSWRDNLLFGSVDFANQRQRRILDAALMNLMEHDPGRSFFVAQGLFFEVGRNGSRLSGGQAQLLSLCRNALRRTPIFVLDEPTSALDPASRDKVAQFLRRWSQKRIVITISHDPELTRHADEILVMSAGRLAAKGTYEDLSKTCEPFRRVFRVK
jgi:ABC-type multidrug transport system fused ATPase/permease subunit